MNKSQQKLLNQLEKIVLRGKSRPLQIIIISILFFAAGYLTALSTMNPTMTPEVSNSAVVAAQVNRVIDGDTIVVQVGPREERVRLIGIDTPELSGTDASPECFSVEAKNKISDLVDGEKIILQNDPTQSDRDIYDRLLRYIYLEDGTNVNLEMISAGYAHEYTYRTAYQQQLTFVAAEQQAQYKNIGLWAPNTCDGQK